MTIELARSYPSLEPSCDLLSSFARLVAAAAAECFSFYFLAYRLLLITFSDRIDCFNRSAFELEARDPRLAWPADPDPPAGYSIVFASSVARARTESFSTLTSLVLFFEAGYVSFIALEGGPEPAGGRGEITLPLSDWAA